MGLTIAVVICAYNERQLIEGCLYSLRAQTRAPDDILVINNASTDGTEDVARLVPGVRVLTEPRKGLVVARETGRGAVTSNVIAYVDADCRAPITWLERLEQHFVESDAPVAVTGPYRFYDWDRTGRTLIRLYDVLVAPPTHALVHRLLGLGAILYGGNFAVRADALARIGGFDQRIEFHGEDTDLVDVWEAANRDDLFSVTSLKHYPYVANSDFHKPKHLYSWKTLVRAEKAWPAIARALRSNVDVALTLYRNGSWAA